MSRCVRRLGRQVREYMKNRRLPKPLQAKILHYYANYLGYDIRADNVCVGSGESAGFVTRSRKRRDRRMNPS